MTGDTSHRQSQDVREGVRGVLSSWRRRLFIIGSFIRRDYFIETSYRFQFVFQFLSIFITVPTFYFLSRLIGNEYARQHLNLYGGDYFSFVLIGISFMGFIRVGLVGITQSIRNAMVEGSLEAMLATPTRPTVIIMASSLWHFIFESVRMCILLLVGFLCFGAQYARPNIPGTLIVLFLSILAFSSLGIISASIIIVLKRGDPMNWIMQALFTLVGGVLFPITILPLWLQQVSYVIPITYSLRAMRQALIVGSPLNVLFPDIIALAVFTLVALPTSIVVCTVMTKKAKVLGSLSSY